MIPPTIILSRILKAIARCLLLGCLFLYPVVFFLGVDRFGPRFLGLGLLALLLLRWFFIKRDSWWVCSVLSGFCLLAIFADSETFLQYYPAVMNALIAGVFGVSLLEKVPFIERCLRAAGKPPPDHALYYLRCLTAIWALALLINAAFSAYTACCMNDEFWLLYNTVVSYLLIAVLMVIELPVRYFYKKYWVVTGSKEGN